MPQTTNPEALIPQGPGFLNQANSEVPPLQRDIFATSQAGVIDQITFFNGETGHYIIKVKSGNPSKIYNVEGAAPYVFRGQAVTFITDQVRPRSAYESVFVARHLVTGLPETSQATKSFLKSNPYFNFAPQLNTLLAKSFGPHLFSIVEDEPEKLLELKSVGPKRQAQIIEAWQNFQARTKLLEYLFSQGLPLSWHELLFKKYGLTANEELKTAPYQIAVELAFPFEKIDLFAKKLPIAVDPAQRGRALIFDLLQKHYARGQCAYPEAHLMSEAERLGVHSRYPIDAKMIDQILEIETIKGALRCEIIDGVPCVYLERIWHLEHEVAQNIKTCASREPPWGYINFNKVLPWAQSLLGIRLAPLQKKAIESALASNFTVITGGPGTGKTTLVRSLVTILKTQHLRVSLCSPTGRAAQRLERATRLPAFTLHRLLKFDAVTGRYRHNEENPLATDLVLIDEASMIDLEIMTHLLRAMPPHAALILVGDANQIPPVGAGAILQSVIDSKQFNLVNLVDIFRQKQNSAIKTNALRIKSGLMPENSSLNSDFCYLPVRDEPEAITTLQKVIKEMKAMGTDAIEPSDLQIVTPLNRGTLGTANLNRVLQSELRFTLQSCLEQTKTTLEPNITHPESGQSFGVGDKVMVIKNNYIRNVYNGDIGFIENLDHDRLHFEVRFETRTLIFKFSEISSFTLAYATSIHKSQGSEYRAVIVMIGAEHLRLAQRELIYTAITRGKERVVLIAHPPTLREVIESRHKPKRWQNLSHLLEIKADDYLAQTQADTRPLRSHKPIRAALTSERVAGRLEKHRNAAK